MPENIEALLDKKTPIDRRKQIFSNQLKYLKELELEELDFPEYKVWDEQDVEKYCNILRSGRLDKYMPSEAYIREVFTLDQQKYEEAQKEAIITNTREWWKCCRVLVWKYYKSKNFNLYSYCR